MQHPADNAIPRLDPEAVFEHSAWMRGLARSLVLSDERADDVVQEAWRAALESPPRRDVPLRAWLAGVVRNQALFLKRSEGRLAGREADAARPETVTSTADLAACADEQRVLLDAVLAHGARTVAARGASIARPCSGTLGCSRRQSDQESEPERPP